MPKIDQYLEFLVESGASDFHLSSGSRPVFRLDGDIRSAQDTDEMTSNMVVSLIEEIMPQSYPDLRSKLAGSAAVDVTGGMEEKVVLLLQMAQLHPGLQASIFSGVEPGNVYNALNGNRIGTLIKGTNE